MKTLTTICICLLVISGAFLFGWRKGKQSVKPQIVVSEKVIRDTERIFEPVPVPELIFIEDTVYIEKIVADAIENVKLIKQTKTYQDSTYKAVVSGYNPNLDYIETYSKTIIRDIQARPQYWSISALVGTSFTGREYSPCAALEIGYNKEKWGISGQFGRDLRLGENYVGLEASWTMFKW